MHAEKIHEPAVFCELGNIAASGMASFERYDAIERLHEIGVNPGTIGWESGKGKAPILLVGRVLLRTVGGIGGFGLVKEDFEISHAG